MKKYIIFLNVVLILGCNKILNPVPTGQIPLNDLFKDESGAVSAVIGAYAPILSVYNGGTSFFDIISMADDDGWTWNVNNQPDLFTLDAGDSRLNMWNTLYAGTTRCNTIINQASNAKYTTSGMENSVVGQAHFLRAFYYFHLVRLFGRVPLVVKQVTTRNDAELGRNPITEVYDTIKNDLLQARNLLPDNYINGPSPFAPGLATKYSAIALSAIVHLELQEWSDAAADAGTVINSSKYSLLPNYADNFNGTAENGAESIFEVQFGGGIAASSSTFSAQMAPVMYNGGSSSGRFPLPTDSNFVHYPGYKSNGVDGAFGDGIVQRFESGDLRFPVAVSSYGIVNFLDPTQPVGSLLYVNKFLDIQNPPYLSNHNYPLIRFAEMYLVRAEALNELGPANASAIADINAVRARAGLPALSSAITSDQGSFRQAIRNERRIELCFECKRYFDLNRWGIMKTTMAIQGITIPPARIIMHPVTSLEFFLYPIPQTEFINNPKLQGDQNPGY